MKKNKTYTLYYNKKSRQEMMDKIEEMAKKYDWPRSTIIWMLIRKGLNEDNKNK